MSYYDTTREIGHPHEALMCEHLRTLYHESSDPNERGPLAHELLRFHGVDVTEDNPDDYLYHDPCGRPNCPQCRHVKVQADESETDA